MRKILNDRYYEIHEKRASKMKYQTFYRVTKEDLKLIDNSLDMKVKIAYFYQKEQLIVQCMPSAFHETASRSFYGDMLIKLASMRLNAKTDYLPKGATRYHEARSSKEADEA